MNYGRAVLVILVAGLGFYVAHEIAHGGNVQ